MDELISAQLATPLYSDDLARRIETSVRTLQEAARAIHGVSLHSYIRLKRLRFAHCQLKSGLPGQSVKAAALDSGFWHMGEFSRLYRSVFGEAPSTTLARANRPMETGSPVVRKRYPYSSNQNETTRGSL
ncbi:helix-turn-helix domain-containing protein [Bradyrhizobium sp. CCGUVB23]|uniref:helix-turn-helix domain-containing protein n=1 Tax=Bradyrhizobium sp. CCGUVB23 TaxID=2949630 RepID=UPI0035322368